MTELHKPVTRATGAIVRDRGRYRQLIATLQPPNVLRLRAKGCRQTYSITLQACYVLAVRAEVEDQRKQKRKRRKKHGGTAAIH